MKKVIYIIAVILLTTTSCTDWTENNFPGYLDNKATLNPTESVVVLGKVEIDAIVKLMKAEVVKLTGTDSVALVNLTNALNNSRQFPTSVDARLWIPKYLKSVYQPANGKLSIDPGSEIVTEYRLFTNIDVAKANILDTLKTADYAAMGTATGYPGKFNNFDATMNHTDYLLTFLTQKYPYAKAGVQVALTYKFYTGSGVSYKTPDFTDIFVKTTTGWVVKPVQDRFKMLADRSWEYVNTLILSETFLDGGLEPFVVYNLKGEGNGTEGFWHYDAKYGAKMTEYWGGANHEGDDWLVSPKLDLSERKVARVVFKAVANFWGTTDDIEIYASSTYVDGSNPDVANWKELTGFVYSLKNYTFYDYQCSLTAYTGKPNVHIAFRYRSTATAAGTAEVTNVIVEAIEVK